MISLNNASILLFFTLLTSPTLSNSSPTLPIWNHVLCLTYGVNYCKVNRCSSVINFEKITIHGLWPNSDDAPGQKPNSPADTNLKDCNPKDQVSAWEVSSIRNELESNWPSVSMYNVKGQPLGFWGYEWRKHGSCSTLDKFSYFRFTLDLYYQVNPGVILQQFPPSATIKYTVTDFQNFHTATSFPQPYLACDNSGDLLLEIKYCLDDTATSFVDCNFYYNYLTNCNADFFIFPM